MQNYYDFSGKTAIVTGSGSKRGFGIATALMFAGYGANVVLVDIDGDGVEFNAKRVEEENPGVKALPIKADLTSEADVKALVEKTMETFDRIDFLINIAGISVPNDVLHISLDEWNKVMNVNITSVFLMCREILPIMQKQHFGRIVNTASVAARDGGHHGGAHYVTSKCATFGLTRHLAKAFAADGITINNIAPGQMLTDGGGLKIEDRKPNPNCPMGRRGTATEFAGAACYLCSEPAAYVTGISIDVNGGLVFPG